MSTEILLTKKSEAGGGRPFDRTKEKARRKEIKKLVGKAISDPLIENGFQGLGRSKWIRETGDMYQLVYLQRSRFSHLYYIEMGVYGDDDIPEGERPDIVYCKDRKRIGAVVGQIYCQRHANESNVQTHARIERQRIENALNFDIPNGFDQYPDEYYFPSVDPKEVKRKIDVIGQVVQDYVPAWFEKNNKGTV